MAAIFSNICLLKAYRGLLVYAQCLDYSSFHFWMEFKNVYYSYAVLHFGAHNQANVRTKARCVKKKRKATAHALAFRLSRCTHDEMMKKNNINNIPES